MTHTLLVMVPTRWRRQNCERLLKTFVDTTDNADIVFITDPDDADSYEDMDFGDALHAELNPRGSVVEKINHVAAEMHNAYDALMYIGDDHLFNTPHWDTIMMGKLEEMGGAGFLYGDDKRRNDIPEMVIISSNIVRALGHFMEPSMNHYYVDNVWADLGFRAGLLRYVPECVFEHLHYQVDKSVPHDQTYSYAESTWGQSDHEAWLKWRQVKMPWEISRLRRMFNPDVKWVRGRV